MEKNVSYVVGEMNDAIFYSDMAEHEYTSYLELVQLPIGEYVKYMGHCIWDSENDYRAWITDVDGEDTEEKEDLKRYLWQQMFLIKHSVYKSIQAIERTLV